MASICLYDMDFLHGSKFIPNLELMKIFNYYYSQGHIVNLAQKNENLDRYTKVIYFKNSPALIIPKKLKLSDERSVLYGYGFYNKFTPLREKIKNVPPNYLIYDTYSDKIKNIKKYEEIKKGALIRIENMDLTDFNKNKKNIYITDYNVCELNNSYSFLKEMNKEHNIYYLYSQKAKNQKSFEQFFTYMERSKTRLIADFDYDFSFFSKYMNESVSFMIRKNKKETDRIFFQRIINMILYNKQKSSKSLNLIYEEKINSIVEKEFKLVRLIPLLIEWGKSNTKKSFYDFNADKKDLVIELSKTYTYLRILLKQNPLSYNIQELDF